MHDDAGRGRGGLEDLALHHKREWLDRQTEKAMRRRRYVRLPPDHPEFDAEDLPHWWQRWLAEAAGGAFLAVFMFVVMWFAWYVLPNPTVEWIAALTERVARLRSPA